MVDTHYPTSARLHLDLRHAWVCLRETQTSIHRVFQSAIHSADQVEVRSATHPVAQTVALSDVHLAALADAQFWIGLTGDQILVRPIALDGAHGGTPLAQVGAVQAEHHPVRQDDDQAGDHRVGDDRCGLEDVGQTVARPVGRA